MPRNCYNDTIVKCQLNWHVSMSTFSDADFAMPQCVIKSFILFSDADFAVAQCVVKLSTLFSDVDFTVAQCVIKSSTLIIYYICIDIVPCFNYPLLWAYIKTCPPAMHLHTSLIHGLERDPAQHVSPSGYACHRWCPRRRRTHHSCSRHRSIADIAWYMWPDGTIQGTLWRPCQCACERS
jgi:hypothetical protein